ncbi:MAG: hypothetical protein AAGN35_08790 [Bacteroidota bacterium]
MATLAEYDEVVLWFEFDLFCQTNLWLLLHKLAAAPPQVRLSLVSPGSVPGIEPFYTMGQLSPHQLMDLFAERVPITPEVIAEGRAVWTAHAQADPEALLAFAQRVLNQLRHLPAAVMAHLYRFPAPADGLNTVERTLLRELTVQSLPFRKLFRRILLGHRKYGVGGLQVERYLAVTCRA